MDWLERAAWFAAGSLFGILTIGEMWKSRAETWREMYYWAKAEAAWYSVKTTKEEAKP